MFRWTQPLACGIVLAGFAGFAFSQTGAAMPKYDAIVPNRAPLATPAYVRLPIGSVRAEGWLLRQLKLQKAGLLGVSEQMYDALTPDSGWLGGKGEGWEKGPYYVKGLIAVAFTLDDAELKQRAQKWVDWALKSQRDDGFFGPASNNDWWPRMVVLYYLRDYYEATGDDRVVPFLTKYFHHQLTALPGRPLQDWGRSRAGDNIDVALWTYNLTGDEKLLDLAKLLYSQAYPWSSIYTDNRFYGFGEDFQPHHIVNVSQALKFSPVAWQFTHDEADKAAYANGVANLNRQYGRIDGQVSGTEMLSGLKSTDGVELCADAERILSSGIALSITGDARIGDEIEKVAYNSLPAHVTPQMRQLTYYQLPNQVTATQGGHGFTQDYGNGNVPGPHSGFPCCCYNWHMGWPKLIGTMWAATNDGGLAALAYGPNRVTTNVAGDVSTTIVQTTDYPFADTITLKLQPQKPATFPLALRVPAWCDDATIAVNGAPIDKAAPASFVTIRREWKAGDTVTLRFPMKVRESRWINNSAGIERGPLAYALKIKEDWKKNREYLQNFDEFEVLPQTPWNYALKLDDKTLANVGVKTRPVGDVPYATATAPVTLTLPARKLPAWGLRNATPNGKVTLGRADGAWHAIADTETSMESGKPHKLRVEAKGQTLRVFVDDKPVLEKNDAAIAAGGVGLRAYESAASFDDITIDGKRVADFANAKLGDWQFFGGKWSVKNGKLTTDSARDAKAVFKPAAGLKDFTLEATVTAPAGDAGVLLRVSDASNQLDGYTGYYVGLSGGRRMSLDASEPPQSPVTSDQPDEMVELIPFGSGKLRVSYFPVLK